jgi:S-methylmethionine-dependent homocysteine/selenocysteine methylase
VSWSATILDPDAITIIDGGTGTEIQRRGVPMDDGTWCAEANLIAPDVVRDVHRAYVDAGAQLLIANTFASSPFLFGHLDRLDELAEIDRRAVQLAREAADGRVPVAGSFSTMRPGPAGSDRTDLSRQWPESEARTLCRAKAEALVDAGVDLIVMEMMRDTDYSIWATEAAMETGLPIWVGLTVERDEHGDLVGWSRPDCGIAEVVDALAATGPQLMAVMHTDLDATTVAIDVVRSRFGGPLGAYPESGYFARPEWVFVDVSVADLVSAARDWIDQGVTVVGGCCGITPDHIAGLAAGLRPLVS